MTRRSRPSVVLAACLALLAGCAGGPDPAGSPSAEPAGTTATPAERTALHVTALAGPTGMGLASLLAAQDAGTTANDYTVTITAAPDDAVGALTSGEADIAALPSNVAAALYAKTAGAVQVIAVATLGVLSVVENGDTVHTVADLAGRTLHASGQGATPEFALEHVLAGNGLTVGTDVTVQYSAQHAELAALLASGQVGLALLPEPFVTVVTAQNPDLRVALDLTQEWQAVSPGSELAMGVLVARREVAAEHPEAVRTFLAEYADSVAAVNADPAAAGELVARYGILESAQVAAAAIPKCHIVAITGAEMRRVLAPFFEVLHAAEPKSVGGQVPDDDFYLVAP